MPSHGTGTSALEYLPTRISLTSLRAAARNCHGCPLYQRATQTVFGAGAAHARVLFIGEQPGNEEDRKGLPFVGPAGRVLDKGLEAAGITRDDVYVTNVVKHFKWVPGEGKRRIHHKPSAREIAACEPWLMKEIDVVKPEVLVCLGATAAQALLGKDFRVSVMSGRPFDTPLARHIIATIHPSSILRQQTSEDRARELAKFTGHLKVVAGLLEPRS